MKPGCCLIWRAVYLSMLSRRYFREWWERDGYAAGLAWIRRQESH